VWRSRGFTSVGEHDAELNERWNKKISSSSIVFHLGDFVFGSDTIDRFKTLCNILNFDTLYIMPGNHCSGWKQVFEAQKQNIWNIDRNKRVIFIPNYLEAVINGQPIVLSHYPLVSFNGQARGSWMLHGHCHAKLYLSEIAPLLYKCRVMDLGVENCSYPKSFMEIKGLMQDKVPFTFDS
jgi:calcineurin-like phosphoesterase family protein